MVPHGSPLSNEMRLGGGECLARGATYQAVADRILPELDHLGALAGVLVPVNLRLKISKPYRIPIFQHMSQIFANL